MRGYINRVDANQTEIIEAFERLGCSVANLSSLGKGVPDLLVGYGGLCCLCVEVKDGSKPPSARKLTEAQKTFHMNWKGGIKVVKDLDGVIETVSLLQKWHSAIRTASLTALRDDYDQVELDQIRSGD